MGKIVSILGHQGINAHSEAIPHPHDRTRVVSLFRGATQQISEIFGEHAAELIETEWRIESPPQE